MSIAFIGAGGTGGYFGGLLARAGEEVSFLARGTQLEALRTHGLTMKSRLAGTFSLPVHATSDPQQIGAVDLVLFSVKTYASRAASLGLHLLMGPETVVLPIQNGIDAAEQLGRQVGMQHLVGGVAYVTSQIESPGVIAQTAGAGSIELGELAGGQSERARRVQQVLRHAAIRAELPPDIRVARLREVSLHLCLQWRHGPHAPAIGPGVCVSRNQRATHRHSEGRGGPGASARHCAAGWHCRAELCNVAGVGAGGDGIDGL
jgi:2-dehydropantoate 2-reductase